MKPSNFKIGTEFTTAGGLYRWRCTDVGSRVIVAIRVDPVEITDTERGARVLSYAQALSEGWFNGPPYALAEHVFDEDGLAGCVIRTC